MALKVCAHCGLISFSECAILFIAVKILGRQKGKNEPDLYSGIEGKIEKAMPLILVISGINLMLAAIWFILMGIVSITTAVTRRKELRTGIFIIQLILGIFAVLIGISSFFRPLGLAIAEGTLIGIYFIETGITMITVGAAAK